MMQHERDMARDTNSKSLNHCNSNSIATDTNNDTDKDTNTTKPMPAITAKTLDAPLHLMHANSAPSEISIPSTISDDHGHDHGRCQCKQSSTECKCDYDHGNDENNNSNNTPPRKQATLSPQTILQSPEHSKYSKILPISCNPYFHELLNKDELSKLKQLRNLLIDQHNISPNLIHDSHLIQFLLSRDENNPKKFTNNPTISNNDNANNKNIKQGKNDIVKEAANIFLAQLKMYDELELNDISTETVLHEIKKGYYSLAGHDFDGRPIVILKQCRVDGNVDYRIRIKTAFLACEAIYDLNIHYIRKGISLFADLTNVGWKNISLTFQRCIYTDMQDSAQFIPGEVFLVNTPRVVKYAFKISKNFIRKNFKAYGEKILEIDDPTSYTQWFADISQIPKEYGGTFDDPQQTYNNNNSNINEESNDNSRLNSEKNSEMVSEVPQLYEIVNNYIKRKNRMNQSNTTTTNTNAAMSTFSMYRKATN